MISGRAATCVVLTVLLGTGLTACGDEGRSETVSVQPAGPSESQPTFSPAQLAYLEDARRASDSIEAGDSGRDATLLAIGQDWCRWRQSPDFGSIPERQFFDEIAVGAEDGAIMRRAAESHLCPS